VNIDFLPRRLIWSSSGSQIIATSFTNDLQIFSSPESFDRILSKKCPGMVSDSIWYPKMTPDDPASCAFAMITPFNPVQLVDSVDGHIRASYRCQYGGDRPAALSCLLFSGNSILAGGVRTLYSCEIVRPDRHGHSIFNCRGSVTSLIGDEVHSAIGLGLSTGDLVFLDLRSNKPIIELSFHHHAVDVIAWNDTKFFTSARLEGTIFGSDLRNPGIPECTVMTIRKSSRLVSLSVFQRWLAIGNEEDRGSILRIDELEREPTRVGIGPTPVIAIAPETGIIAVASGCHKIIQKEDEDGEEDDDELDVSFEPRLARFEIIPPMAD
jgi:hypothetical protein